MVIKFPQKKRKAGTRAGMTRTAILSTAAQLWVALGPEHFSIRALARTLKVTPTTIHAHIKGGTSELQDEIVRLALADLAPPYKLQQDPKDYLRDFFRSALQTSRQQPALGRLIILRLTDDPIMSRVFAERILVTLAGLTKKHDLAWGLHRFIARLAGLIMVETGTWATSKPDTIKQRIASCAANLSQTEFPTLKQAAESLAADLSKRAEAKYLQKEAVKAANALVLELSKGPS
jgi:AcrR family transcriptional regulator